MDRTGKDTVDDALVAAQRGPHRALATCRQDETSEVDAPSRCRPSSPHVHQLEIGLRRTVRTSGPSGDFVVRGDLDDVGASQLAHAWAAGVTSLPTCVHLDLGRVDFCNATGVRTVDQVLTSSREHGLEITLSVPAHLDWLLRLVGVDVAGLRQVDVVPRSTRGGVREVG